MVNIRQNRMWLSSRARTNSPPSALKPLPPDACTTLPACVPGRCVAGFAGRDESRGLHPELMGAVYTTVRVMIPDSRAHARLPGKQVEGDAPDRAPAALALCVSGLNDTR